jgi:hypothetical protein
MIAAISMGRGQRLLARALAAVWTLVLTLALHPALAARVEAAATLTGRVVDESGGVVAHADIALIDLATGLERKTETTERGEFVLLGLPPGRYQLTAQRDGFAPLQVPDLQIHESDEATLLLTLKITPISELEFAFVYAIVPIGIEIPYAPRREAEHRPVRRHPLSRIPPAIVFRSERVVVPDTASALRQAGRAPKRLPTAPWREDRGSRRHLEAICCHEAKRVRRAGVDTAANPRRGFQMSNLMPSLNLVSAIVDPKVTTLPSGMTTM